MIDDTFGMEDEAYWTDPWVNRKAIQRPLMQGGQEAFIIGAPKVVPLDRHKTLPVAVLRTRKAQGGSPVDFRPMAVLAAWDINAGRLSARMAFPKAPPAPPATAPKRPAGKGDSFSGDATAMISEAGTLDLAARLQLPLASGEYVVSLLCLDQAANQCRMKVVDSAAFHDAEAEAYLRALREEQMGPARVHPAAGQGAAAYTQLPASPAIPEDTGIALAAQRVTVLRPDRPCMLHGSFRLPVPAPAAKTPPGAGEAAPTAIVPIGLLLTGSITPDPVVIHLNVPAYAPLEKAGKERIAIGHFALDLCAHARLAGVVQTYFVYAFSGEAMAGPVLAAFVSPVLTWLSPEEFARQAQAQRSAEAAR